MKLSIIVIAFLPVPRRTVVTPPNLLMAFIWTVMAMYETTVYKAR